MLQLPVRPLSRVVGGALVVILALAAVGLYGWPGETERLGPFQPRPPRVHRLGGGVRRHTLSRRSGSTTAVGGAGRRGAMSAVAVVALLGWLLLTMSLRRAAPPSAPVPGREAL